MLGLWSGTGVLTADDHWFAMQHLVSHPEHLSEEFRPVQVSFDSTEPLEQVLAVLGAVYSTRLTVSSGGQQQAVAAPRREARSGRRTRTSVAAAAQPATAGRSRRSGRAIPARVDVAAARAWAREQGMTVSSRGQLGAAVLAAYQTANA